MKTILPLVASLLVAAPLASGVEYKTIVALTGEPATTYACNPTDVIEFKAISPGLVVYLTFEGGGETHTSTVGTMFAGLSQIQITHLDHLVYTTIKITPASEFNSVGPTSVLVLPENATGNFDLTIESSSDMVTWRPIHSEAIEADAISRMFRVRIAKRD